MAVIKSKNKNDQENHTEPVQESLPAESELAKTNLVFHPDWDVSNQEKYVYMYKHQQLPLLKKNQLSINGLQLVEFQDGFVVVAFLRNTLDKSIRFENVDILVLDEDGKALARKRFELDCIGEIPANACMPWRFLFENEDKLAESIPEEGWSIAFELKKNRPNSHQLDLDESWEKELVPVQKEKLVKLVASLPQLGPNEVNLLGLEANKMQNGNLTATILIRNGDEKDLQIQKMPLILEDAAGEIVCRGSFSMEQFTVKANTSKPWTFIFPKELVIKENPDLSKWKIRTPS